MSRSTPDTDAARHANRPAAKGPGNRAASSATLVDFLGHVDVLAGVPTELREELAADAVPVELSAGEWLFRAGDPGSSAYVVRTGRLEVIAESGVVIGEVKRGGVIGELALLREEARAASVRARRDTELFELNGETFVRLLREVPEFAVSLTRELAGQLAATRPIAPPRASPVTIAVVALDSGAPARQVTARLAEGLSRYGSLAHLDDSDADRPSGDLPAILESAERAHDRVLLEGHGHLPDDPWNGFCLREADLVVGIGSGRPDTAWLGHAAELQGCELLVAGGLLPEDILGYVRSRVRSTSGRALPSCSRPPTRSRADLPAGRWDWCSRVAEPGHSRTSASSRCSATRACASTASRASAWGASWPERWRWVSSWKSIYERFVRHFVAENPSNDYTLPAVAVLRGRKTQRILEEVMGETHIDQLPKSFFCLSCDLVARKPVVHRTGLLREAIYASLAIPGVFPPVAPGDGRLLVDGGVLDNLPVETMSRAHEGPVIASDVTAHDGRWAQSRRSGPAKLNRLMVRALTGTNQVLPRLGETLLRTFTLGSADTHAAARAHADLVVVPPVGGVGLMDWKQLPQLREAGRAAARAVLEESPETVAAWTA